MVPVNAFQKQTQKQTIRFNMTTGHLLPNYKRIVVALLGLSLISLGSANAGLSQAQIPLKNVIYLIGDGMGLSQVSGAIAMSQQPLALERAQAIGLTKTSSANAYVTDSAAAGTALATGIKTNNGVIGQDASGTPIRSLLSYAAEVNKSTGIVVTSTITHATPAAFFGHNPSRLEQDALAKDLLVSKPDVAIGGGRRHFEDREDKANLTETLRNDGYTIAYTLEEVLDAATDTPLLGLLNDEGMPSILEGRADMLPRSVSKALEMLETNPEGFILIVEGSQIDWGGHRNHWEMVATELYDFDAAVKIAMDYADAHPDTLVIITADHETGGLSLNDADLETRTLSPSWSTKGHTATMVPVYAYGSNAQRFSGIYENTEIFHRLMQTLGLKKNQRP